MTPKEIAQLRIHRLEAEIDRLRRQTTLDAEFESLRIEKLRRLNYQLDSKRRALAHLESKNA